jgi:tetraacyldisaccharide 4'-kinase
LLASHTVDILIADDGLQHYFLARDIEIMLSISAVTAGCCRRALYANRYKDDVIYRPQCTCEISAAAVPGIPADAVRMQLQAQQAYQLAEPECRQPLANFAAKRLCAVAGIGHPQRFFTTLANAGLQCEGVALPDHFAFDAATFQPSLPIAF